MQNIWKRTSCSFTLWHFLCFYYFFFLSHSNTGADQITKTAVDFWKNGKDREEMMLKDFESFIPPIVFNSDQSECILMSLSFTTYDDHLPYWKSLFVGGFSKSTLIDSCLLDVFIPFLPLEYKHVVQCAMAAMRDKGLQPDENVADQVARSLVYHPKPERVFATSGCNTVANRVHSYRWRLILLWFLLYVWFY